MSKCAKDKSELMGLFVFDVFRDRNLPKSKSYYQSIVLQSYV